jgi:hypothetical protein
VELQVAVTVCVATFSPPDLIEVDVKVASDTWPLPFAEPTGYGLGRGGWVTASFGERDNPPLELLREWLDESYRAVAPKKLASAIPQPPETSVTRAAGNKRAQPPQRTKRPAGSPKH